MTERLRNMTAVYLLRGDEVLLLYRQGGTVVTDVYTGSAGGHFEPWELNNPKACVLRELWEELGLTEDDLGGLSLRYVMLRCRNGELRQNYYFFARLLREPEGGLASNEGTLRWVKLTEALSLEMPYMAEAAVRHYLHTGRLDDKVYAGVADGECVVFTELANYRV